MILEIISKLKNQLLKDSEVEELYKEYIYSKELSARIEEFAKSYTELESNIKELQEKINSFGLFRKVLERNSFKTQKQELAYLKIQLETVESEYFALKESLEQIEFKPEELKKIENYTSILDLEKDYSMGTYNSVIDTLMEYFDSDIKKLISYCNNNGILLNFSGEVEEMFLDNLIKSTEPRVNFEKKPTSFDDIFLVRKTKGIPIDDKIMPTSLFLKEEILEDVYYNDESHEIKLTVPSSISHPTSHWTLNMEVISHDAGSWEDCDVIILQPFNDNLYNQAAGLNPIDTVFEGTIDLKNYIVICKDEKTAQAVMEKNKNATTIIFSKEKINGAGNKLLGALGIWPYYKTFENKYLDMNGLQIEDYYSDEFVARCPKFVSHTDRGPQNIMHECYSDLRSLCKYSQRIDHIINFSLDQETFDDSVLKIFDGINKSNISILSYWDYSCFSPRNQIYRNIRYSQIIPWDTNNSFGLGFDFFTDLTPEEFNPEFLFNKLIEGVEITEKNESAIKVIKQNMFAKFFKIDLSKIKSGGSDVDVRRQYESFVGDFMIWRKIITSPVINKKVVNKTEYISEIPIEYYDFTKVDELLNGIIENNPQLRYADLRSFLEAQLVDIREIIEVPITKPQSAINEFIIKINYYASMEKRDRDALILGDLNYNVPHAFIIRFLELIDIYSTNRNINGLQEIICHVKACMPEMINEIGNEEKINKNSRK